MDKASEALEKSQAGSQYGFDDDRSSVKQPSSLGIDVRSKASAAASAVSSKHGSHAALSHSKCTINVNLTRVPSV